MIDLKPLVKFPENSNDKDSLYFYYVINKFNSIPSELQIFYEIESNKFWDLLNKKYPDCINNVNSFYNIAQHINEKENINESIDYFLELTDNLYCVFSDMVYLDDNDEEKKIISNVRFLFDKNKNSKEDINILNKEIEEIRITDDSNKYYVIISSPNGYRLQSAVIKDIDVNIKMNYGKDFVKKSDNMLKQLTEKKSGILLLFGESGSGKTTFIRYLINKIANKKTIIYVPSYMMSSLASPDFIAFMRSNKDSILILEDAEAVLCKRGNIGTDDQAVSNILNMTDGVLNDLLKLQIIATFNSNRKDIDSALLRSGRLIDEHHFTKLSKVDAEALASSLGKVTEYKNGATLADIYADVNNISNEDDEDDSDIAEEEKVVNVKKTKRVGFKK